MTTYSAVPGDDRCECTDAADGHPLESGHTHGQCTNKATSTLWRVDMEDVNGTRFCNDCAEDAWESDLFTESPCGPSIDEE